MMNNEKMQILEDYNTLLKISTTLDKLESLIDDMNDSDGMNKQYKSTIEELRIYLKLKRLSLKKK